MLARIRDEGGLSYQHFSDPGGLKQLVENDLAVLLSERFEMTRPGQGAAGGAPLAGAVPVPARRLGPGFADGVRFVGLAAVPAADLVALAIAAGLGLSTPAGQLAADLEFYLRPHGSRSGLDAVGEDIKFTCPGKSHLILMLPGG